MSRKHVIGVAAVAVVILLFASLHRGPAGAQEKQPPAQKWEYKVVLPTSIEDPLMNQDQLDRLGADGWELCAAHSSTRPNYFIFKRPRR